MGTVLNMVNSLNPGWSQAVVALNAALAPLVQDAGGVLVDLHGLTGLCSPDEGDTQRMCSQCNPGASICKTGCVRAWVCGCLCRSLAVPQPPSFSLLADGCPNSDDDVDAVDCDVAVQSYDRIHPTAAGYSLMAGAWASAISDHVPME